MAEAEAEQAAARETIAEQEALPAVVLLPIVAGYRQHVGQLSAAILERAGGWATADHGASAMERVKGTRRCRKWLAADV